MNSNIKWIKDPMNTTGRDHQTGVYGSTNNSTQWVPGSLIEPVQEIIIALSDHVISGSIVKPLIKIQWLLNWNFDRFFIKEIEKK